MNAMTNERRTKSCRGLGEEPVRLYLYAAYLLYSGKFNIRSLQIAIGTRIGFTAFVDFYKAHVGRLRLMSQTPVHVITYTSLSICAA